MKSHLIAKRTRNPKHRVCGADFRPSSSLAVRPWRARTERRADLTPQEQATAAERRKRQRTGLFHPCGASQRVEPSPAIRLAHAGARLALPQIHFSMPVCLRRTRSTGSSLSASAAPARTSRAPAPASAAPSSSPALLVDLRAAASPRALSGGCFRGGSLVLLRVSSSRGCSSFVGVRRVRADLSRAAGASSAPRGLSWRRVHSMSTRMSTRVSTRDWSVTRNRHVPSVMCRRECDVPSDVCLVRGDA